MANRSATDTIKGYFYQFDYTIQKLLELKTDTDFVTVEGVEDVDISSSASDTAIQCKYYAKTEYNHSVIAKPIRLMLTHFSEVENGRVPAVDYSLYGHFKSGQDKHPTSIDLEFLKGSLLTYTEKKARIEHHAILGLTDSQLSKFLSRLRVDVFANDYEAQQAHVCSLLAEYFGCDVGEAMWHYYPNAVREIKRLATQDSLTDRMISKKDFVQAIDRKETLFNAWFIQLKGAEAYFKGLKKKYFTSLNVSPAHRIFLIECKEFKPDVAKVKEVVRHISNKFSKISKRVKPAFCPYIYFHNLSEELLVEIKKELQAEGFGFIDGYDFKGAEFSLQSIGREPGFATEIKVKLLNTIEDVELTVNGLQGQVEVFQFYGSELYYDSFNSSPKRVEIQLDKLEHLLNII